MRNAAAALYLLTAPIALGQNAPAVWAPAATHCSTVYFNGVPNERYSDLGIIIDAAKPAHRDDHFAYLQLGIVNPSPAAVDVNPADFTAELDTGATVRAVDMDPILSKEEQHDARRERMSAAFSAFGAGMAQQTGTVHNPDGTTSTVTLNSPAQASNVQAYPARGSESAHLLRRNTLAPGTFALGHVYFPVPKHAQIARVTVRENGKEYVFSWPATH